MADAAPFGRGRVRRLLGLDRSAPPPSQTGEDQPLNPWTLPNLVGYLRLAGLPIFLLLAFGSDDGQGVLIAMIYWLISAGDYLDGLLARLTGQYSRLGALLDPLIDRLTILCGAVVCWHFALLPRWALAALALREVAMLAIAQYGLRHGARIAVNWPGRISVFPIMGGIFLALLVETWVADALLIWGLAMAVWATVLYVRAGRAAVREGAAQDSSQAP
ncbi:MAG TPA: CDP-alcohol phosphatidyltransferase family protein [Solirubrobacterales bacterium]|nr:CDP-alcohol phosphatidyltransferase family protein [Solirubrobacterales bacterium]